MMGATGNVTGVHLDMIVTKDGKSIKRDGTTLADAPPSIARRASRGARYAPTAVKAQSAPTQEATQNTRLIADTVQAGTASAQATDQPLMDATPTTLLQGSVGLAVPETQTENRLYAGIADMGLGGGLESIYAEAARAIAGARDKMDSRPMIQSDNPLRAELGEFFDTIEI